MVPIISQKKFFKEIKITTCNRYLFFQSDVHPSYVIINMEKKMCPTYLVSINNTSGPLQPDGCKLSAFPTFLSGSGSGQPLKVRSST